MSEHEALLREKFRVLSPQLLRAARHYLVMVGWAEGAWYRPAVLETRELVHTTAERFLSGELTWPERMAVTEKNLVRVFNKTMFRVTMDRRKSAAVDRDCDGGDATDREMADEPSPSQRYRACWLTERIKQIFAGDDEALKVIEAFAEGFVTPRDVAEELRRGDPSAEPPWTAARVSELHRRMKRRLESLGITFDGEAEPSSSGPQRRDDEHVQAAGGRHRAPDERHPGARVPDRGRAKR